MPEFLELVPPQDALRLLLDHLPPASLIEEEVDTPQAVGRITACPVASPENLPAFTRSTVDGFAVRGRDTHGASESLPAYLSLVGECPMGAAPPFEVGAAQAALIHTGGMLPNGADAVVMLEYTQVSRPGEIEVLRAVPAGENLISVGEDVEAGQVVLPAAKRLRTPDIGGLMALGITQVRVVQKPRVAIISSGDEVIDPSQPPQPGQVRDVNSYTLATLVSQAGGAPVRYGILPDRAEALRAILSSALSECQMVIITAGSSASARDLTAVVINQMGDPGVLVHGVNVKPGKPTILAVCSGKPVIGLPGNPVSALVIAGLFVRPLIGQLLGLAPERIEPAVAARLSMNVPSQAGRDDWIPVRLRREQAGYRADPIFYKSNLIFTLSQADGLVHIPPDATGLEAGADVDVYLID